MKIKQKGSVEHSCEWKQKYLRQLFYCNVFLLILIIFYCFTKYLLLHGVIAKNLKILQSSLYILRLYAIGKPHSQLYLLQKVYLILDCLVISALETHPHSQIC